MPADEIVMTLGLVGGGEGAGVDAAASAARRQSQAQTPPALP